MTTKQKVKELRLLADILTEHKIQLPKDPSPQSLDVYIDEVKERIRTIGIDPDLYLKIMNDEKLKIVDNLKETGLRLLKEKNPKNIGEFKKLLIY